MSDPFQAIQDRHGKATKGPWRAMAAGNCEMEDGRLVAIAEVEGLPRPWNPVWVGWRAVKNHFKTFLRQEDADFIAHAWEDIRTLLAEREALRGVIEGMRDELHDAARDLINDASDWRDTSDRIGGHAASRLVADAVAHEARASRLEDWVVKLDAALAAQPLPDETRKA